MKSVSVTTTYYANSRVLSSTAILSEFVPGMPEKQIKGVQADTLTLFETGAIMPVDVQAITASQMRALVACSKELTDWLRAGCAAGPGVDDTGLGALDQRVSGAVREPGDREDALM